MAGWGLAHPWRVETWEQFRCSCGGAQGFKWRLGCHPVPAVTVAPVLLPSSNGSSHCREQSVDVEGLNLRVLITPDFLKGPGIAPFRGWESVFVGTEVGVQSLTGVTGNHCLGSCGEQRA